MRSSVVLGLQANRKQNSGQVGRKVRIMESARMGWLMMMAIMVVSMIQPGWGQTAEFRTVSQESQCNGGFCSGVLRFTNLAENSTFNLVIEVRGDLDGATEFARVRVFYEDSDKLLDEFQCSTTVLCGSTFELCETLFLNDDELLDKGGDLEIQYTTSEGVDGCSRVSDATVKATLTGFFDGDPFDSNEWISTLERYLIFGGVILLGFICMTVWKYQDGLEIERSLFRVPVATPVAVEARVDEADFGPSGPPVARAIDDDP